VSDQRPLLLLPEVAEELRVSVGTLRNWIRDGRVRAIRLPGGTLRITRAEFDRVAASDGKVE